MKEYIKYLEKEFRSMEDHHDILGKYEGASRHLDHDNSFLYKLIKPNVREWLLHRII